VPEVVEHGVTGFVVESEEEAIAAVRNIGQLDRHRVRAAFEARFASQRMAQEYVRLYRALAKGPHAPARPSEAKPVPG